MRSGAFKQRGSVNKENKEYSYKEGKGEYGTKEKREYNHYSFSKNLKNNNPEKVGKKSSNFVDRVNGYIEMISPHEHPTRQASRDNRSVAGSGRTKKYKKGGEESREKLMQKVKVERDMNRNLQKCIIEIQKMLWDRNDRLEELELQFRDRDGFVARKGFAEEEQASIRSCKRVKDSHKQLKRKVNTLGMRQILSNMDQDSYNEQSNKSITESSNSITSHSHSYIKIRRPRTESQSESMLSKRKK